MKRRTGATLVEVLVAIFIMGIGLLAMLTLFPIGILTMQQAILDERASQSVKNAVALAQGAELRKDSNVATALTNPAATVLKDADPLFPSYPVYVDPTGVLLYAAAPDARDWVGGMSPGILGGNMSGIRRVSPNYVFVNGLVNPLDIRRFFTLPDDIVFDQDGEPAYQIPGQLATGFDRLGDFSWGYLLHRPMQGAPDVVSMSVVVYYKRPLVSQAGENAFQALFDPAQSTIRVSVAPGNALPQVRPGSWILDSTPVANGTCRAQFYRLVGVVQVDDFTVDLEIQTPIRAAAGPGTIVVLDGVSEVFEVGAGKQGAAP